MLQTDISPLNPCPKAVIFDMDGTLLDSVDLIVASFQHVHKTHLGIDIPRSQVTPWIGRPLIDIYSHLAPGRAEELMQAYLDWNMEHMPELQKTFPGTVDLLTKLRERGYQVGLATSKRRLSALASLEIAQLGQLLDCAVFMEDTQKHKPNPDPILEAVRRLDVRLEDAVYVGDAASDITAANAAQVRGIAVTWGAGDKTALLESQPEAIAQTFDQLAVILGL